MQCTRCRTELAAQDRFCPQCGAPRPTEAERFAWAAHEMSLLVARYRAGGLDDTAFGKAANDLAIQDDRGHHWIPKHDGTWHYWDGNTWVIREPPVSVEEPASAKAVPPARDASPSRTQSGSQSQPAPKKNKRVLIASVVLVLLALLVLFVTCGGWPSEDRSPLDARTSSSPTAGELDPSSEPAEAAALQTKHTLTPAEAAAAQIEPTPIPAAPDLGPASFTPPSNEKLILSEEWGIIPVNQLSMVLGEGFVKADAERIAQGMGGAVVGEFAYINLYQLEIATTTEAELRAAIGRVGGIDGVELVFPLQTIELYDGDKIVGERCSPLNDPVYDGENGKPYEMIGLQRACDLVRGAGMKLNPVQVGIIDDGLYRAKGEFDGSEFTTMGDADLQNPQKYKDGSIDPSGGHGAGVASVFGADPNNGGVTGVASPVLGKAMKVVSSNLRGADYTDVYTDTVPADLTQQFSTGPKAWSDGGLRALRDQIQNGATIINCSWGTRYAHPETVKAYRRFFSQMDRDHPHVLFVCAAGNAGQSLDGTRHYPAGISLPNVISVGNVENDGTIGNCKTNTSGTDFEVTLAAPGEHVPRGVSDDGVVVNKWGGTSCAAPQVTAAAAILRSINPKLTAGEIKKILADTATRTVKTSGQDVTVDPGLGAGVLRVDEAVLRVMKDLDENLDAGRLEKLAVIDGLATSEESSNEEFNDYTIQASVGAVGQAGADVTIEVHGEGMISGSTSKHLGSAGESTWGLSLPADEKNVTVRVRRLDTQACSNILIPNIPLELSGWYVGSLTYEQVVFNGQATLPFIDIDEDGENDIDPEECEEQARELQGQTRSIAWDFQPTTSTSGTAVLYHEDDESGELEEAWSDVSYDVQGTRVLIGVEMRNDPRVPIELQVMEWHFEGELSMSDQGMRISGTFLYSLPDAADRMLFRMSGPWSVSQPRAE